jgi:cell division protein FtsB
MQRSKPAQADGLGEVSAVVAREHRRLSSRVRSLQRQLKEAQQETADLRTTILILNANIDLLMSDRCAWIYVQ